MAPTFKKSKDYDAALASNTLGSPIHAAPRNLTYKEAATGASTTKPAGDEPDDSRALLIALGLAEAEEADPVEAQPQPAPRKQAPPQLEATGSGQIGAFYPKEGTCTTVPAGSNAYDALRARLEALTVKLMQGRLGDADSDEVQGLLLDQQHQIDLLLRGQSSLRGSMNNMRRSTMEKDAQTKELHQQLEQQHGAALREMESKLEKAIEQVQQLQLTSRDRQRQQTASLPHSLKSASEESSQLRGKADALQVMPRVRGRSVQEYVQNMYAWRCVRWFPMATYCTLQMVLHAPHLPTMSPLESQAALDSKEQELQAAQQHQEGLEAQLVQARSALEAQRASFKQQLQSLAADCQAALADVQTKAAALTAAQAESQQLSQQLDEAAVLQQHLTGLSEQLQAQVKQAAAVAQQQQAESAAQKQELLAQIQQLQRDLQATSTAQEQGKQETQVLQQQCRDLGASLAESRAEVQELQAQLAAANKQQASVSDESAGVRQELAAAVQAKTDLTLQLEDATTTIRQLQVQQQQAEAALQSLKQQEAASVANKAAGMQEQQALQRQVQELEAQCKQGTEQAAKLEAELAQVQEQLQAAEQQAQDNSTKITAAESDSQQLQFKLAALQTELQKVQRTSSATIQQLRQEADDARQQLSTVKRLTDKQIAKAQAAAQQEVDQFRQRWRHEFERRRKLHNQVIELKGNIRVLARIRPMIEKERSAACSEGGGVQEAVRALDEETVVLDAANGPREFSFDRVFGPSDGQSAVYDEVSGIVTSIMDGYNACIMAYGQTGSGKTFTLEGPADDPGVNSRALAELFQVARERAAEVAYTLSASVVEIYQEQIFDLLTGSKDTGDSLSVKEGPSGLYIPNLRIEAVSGPEDVAAVLQKGRQNRSTFATNMNEHSSRSHLVLSIYATAKHLTKDTTWSSKLHLIDLAGSERVSRSGAEGERLKEAAAINKSLSALGDVVSALQQRSGHVPYRNSKLTRLLEDSLGGSSKTLLVVNCSPAAENVAETKCSLDFATRARKVELGAAVRAGESSSGGGGAVGAAPSSQSGTSGGGRDSPINGSPSRPSQLCTSSGPSAGGGSGSANSSPRVSGRYTGSGGHANELRQAAVTRRSWAVASTSQKEDK